MPARTTKPKTTKTAAKPRVKAKTATKPRVVKAKPATKTTKPKASDLALVKDLKNIIDKGSKLSKGWETDITDIYINCLKEIKAKVDSMKDLIQFSGKLAKEQEKRDKEDKRFQKEMEALKKKLSGTRAPAKRQAGKARKESPKRPAPSADDDLDVSDSEYLSMPTYPAFQVSAVNVRPTSVLDESSESDDE